MAELILGAISLTGALPHVLAADTSSPVLWYVTRTTAVSAYVALTLSVVLGMMRTIARRSHERLSGVVDDLHQFVATLAGLFVLGHVVALALDPFLPFSVLNLLAPVNEPYRPLAVSLGVFSLYAMVLLLFSSWLRRRLPHGLWRGIHYISFVAFVLVTLHGWLAGSDSGESWMRGIYGFSAAAVAFLTLMRMLVGASAPSVREA